MQTGTVAWYSEGQGRGMIAPDGSDAEISVACSDILAEGFKILYEGQRVMFEVAQTRKGPAAKNVISRDQDERPPYSRT